MRKTSRVCLLVIAFGAICAAGCYQGDAQKNTARPNNTSSPSAPASTATPGSNFTRADVAKLKWIEGSWRGMDGDKPFFEGYRLEDTSLVVQSLKEDGSADGAPERFELKDGRFGKCDGDTCSGATEITDTYVQFVPTVAGKGNNFRFERQADGTWTALLEWPANGDKPARRKVYKMEHWEPAK
jgi:hypothetical protein